jgi:UDP-N-acetylmuramate--alanine ligase
MALVMPTEPVPLGELGRVHFIGIGGAGMSAIARIMVARGVTVSGSDSAGGAALDELAARGARVYVGHAAGQLGDADTVVVSSAIRQDNPELAEAGRRGLRVLHRAAALAALMSGRRVTAVTGTHGKTTTTSMITTVLLDCGAEPAYAIGGVLAATGAGAADGAGRDFVAEADESDGSFLMYAPDIAVVTNVEADHLDNYGTEQAYRASFGRLLHRIKPGGLLVTSADDPGTAELIAQAHDLASDLGGDLCPRVVTFGESPDADYRVADVTVRGMTTTLRVSVKAGPAGSEQVAGQESPLPFLVSDFDLRIDVPGRHNALNAAAAFATAVELGVAPPRAAAALAGYRGAARRLEPKGEAGGVLLLDTYAHHPTELAADLRAAREIGAAPAEQEAEQEGGRQAKLPDGRVIAVFQPHLYSRTRIFAAEFAEALELADEAVILDVYAAREDPEPGVTGRLIADAVAGAHFVPEFADVPKVVAALAAPGDIVLTMGAGDVTRLGPLILDAIGQAGPGLAGPRQEGPGQAGPGQAGRAPAVTGQP